MNAGRWPQDEKKEFPSGSRNNNGRQRQDIEFLSSSEETSGIWKERSKVALSGSLASHWLLLSSRQYDLTNTSHACLEMCCLDIILGSLFSCSQWARVFPSTCCEKRLCLQAGLQRWTKSTRWRCLQTPELYVSAYWAELRAWTRICTLPDLYNSHPETWLVRVRALSTRST